MCLPWRNVCYSHIRTIRLESRSTGYGPSVRVFLIVICPPLTLRAVLIGAILGFISNYHQQHLYNKAAKRNGGKAPPEARLYWAAYGGLLFPIGLYVFAWTARPSTGIHWIVPMIFLCLSYWGIACIFAAIL